MAAIKFSEWYMAGRRLYEDVELEEVLQLFRPTLSLLENMRNYSDYGAWLQWHEQVLLPHVVTIQAKHTRYVPNKVVADLLVAVNC